MLAGFNDAAWLMQLNIAMFERAAIELEAAPFDVVHAFGSSVAHAAVSLRRAFDVPLVASITPARGEAGAQVQLMRDADAVVVGSRRSASLAPVGPSRIHIVRSGPGYAPRLLAVYRDAVHAGLSAVSSS